MLAKTNCEKATTKRFRAKLKTYHHHYRRCSKAVAVHHGRTRDKVRLGDLVTIPNSDLHHVMDADAMQAMHLKLWSSPSSYLHEWWRAAFRNYVEASALSTRRTVNV